MKNPRYSEQSALALRHVDSGISMADVWQRTGIAEATMGSDLTAPWRIPQRAPPKMVLSLARRH